MKRFNYDDDEDEDFKDEYFLPDDIGADDDIDSEEYWHEVNIEYAKLSLVKNEQDQKLLFRVIKSLQRSWFWGWKSHATQMKNIVETFLAYKNLIGISSEMDKFGEAKQQET